MPQNVVIYYLATIFALLISIGNLMCAWTNTVHHIVIITQHPRLSLRRHHSRLQITQCLNNCKSNYEIHFVRFCIRIYWDKPQQIRTSGIWLRRLNWLDELGCSRWFRGKIISSAWNCRNKISIEFGNTILLVCSFFHFLSKFVMQSLCAQNGKKVSLIIWPYKWNFTGPTQG